MSHTWQRCERLCFLKLVCHEFVMHFFISTHLQVNPSILNLQLITVHDCD